MTQFLGRAHPGHSLARDQEAKAAVPAPPLQRAPAAAGPPGWTQAGLSPPAAKDSHLLEETVPSSRNPKEDFEDQSSLHSASLLTEAKRWTWNLEAAVTSEELLSLTNRCCPSHTVKIHSLQSVTTYTVGLTLPFFALNPLVPIHITIKLCPPPPVVYMRSF